MIKDHIIYSTITKNRLKETKHNLSSFTSLRWDVGRRTDGQPLRRNTGRARPMIQSRMRLRCCHDLELPLFPVDEDVESEAGEDGVLELWVLVHDDGDDADVGEEAPGAANDVLLRQPVLQRKGM